jgi:hypothetical protein
MGWFVNLFWRALRPPHMTQSLEVITWAHGMELEPPEPPRAAFVAPRNYLAPPAAPSPVGGLPPSPEQRDKAAPLYKGVKPPYHAGNCRGLEAPGALARWPLKPASLVHQLALVN